MPTAQLGTSKKNKDAAETKFENDVKEMFNAIDANGDKSVTADELYRYTKKLGITMTTKEVKDAVQKLDGNRNGKLEFHEFRKFIQQQSDRFKKEQQEELNHMKETFKMFDRDGNGVIDRLELRNALKTLLGEKKVTNDDLTEMMNEVDLNNDGRIDFEEFKQIWSAFNGEEGDLTAQE